MLHPDYLDTASGPIGRVVTSEEHPATAHEFYFWTADRCGPEPGHRAHRRRRVRGRHRHRGPRRPAPLRTCSPSSTTSTPSTATRLCRPSQRVEILVFRARVLHQAPRRAQEEQAPGQERARLLRDERPSSSPSAPRSSREPRSPCSCTRTATRRTAPRSARPSTPTPTT